MRLTKASTKEQYQKIQKLYHSAFPKVERKPFALMVMKQRTGSMELFCIEDDDGTFIGLAIYVLYADLALLDYYAICEAYRNKGIGSEVLKMLQCYYPKRRFFLEIEDAGKPVLDQATRIRRRNFYLRNGMTVMPFLVDLFSVEMEVLTYEAEITFEEYFRTYERVFGKMVSRNVKLIREGNTEHTEA